MHTALRSLLVAPLLVLGLLALPACDEEACLDCATEEDAGGVGDGRGLGEVPTFGEGDCVVEVGACICSGIYGCMDWDCNPCADWCDNACWAPVRYDCAGPVPQTLPTNHPGECVDYVLPETAP